MTPPHVLRLVTSLPPNPGGLEVHARELTLEQARRGLRVELAFSDGDHVVATGVRNERCVTPGSRLGFRALAQHQFAMTVARSRELHAERPLVVHAHGDYALALAAASLARRFACPSVLTIHGSLSRRSVHRFLGRRIYAKVDRIIGVSPLIREQLVALGVPAERIAVVSSGVRHERYAPSAEKRRAARAALGISERALVVAAVGRLHPVKGFEFLIDAAGQLRDRMPVLEVLVAGEGPDEPKLCALAAAAGNVRLLGRCSRDRIVDVLAASDLFVLPSIDLGSQAEGTPTSIMEAMAAGLAVIATRTGGIPHLLKAGENGILVEPRSVRALADAIEHLAQREDLRACIGETNRAAARDRDWSVIAERVSNVYRDAGARLPDGL